MNKKEIGEIAWIIAQIHAGAIDGAFIAGELARICPKAAAESKELMPYTLFEEFYQEITSYMTEEEFGNNWTLKRDQSLIAPFRANLSNPHHKAQAQDVFARYAEMVGLDRPLRSQHEYVLILSDNEWKEAKLEIAEDYGYDLGWLP